MSRQTATPFVVAISAFTALNCGATPQSGGETSEADKKAFAYLRAYSEWKQAPVAELEMCKKLDPAGGEARQKAYVVWADGHEQDFAIFDGLANDILPQLLPTTAKTASRPVEFFNNITSAKFKIGLDFASPEMKSKFCSTYTTSDLLTDPKWKVEGAAFLQDWLRNHPVLPVAK